jgi:pimeloyl-ACP methyl ester carboxylesterase
MAKRGRNGTTMTMRTGRTRRHVGTAALLAAALVSAARGQEPSPLTLAACDVEGFEQRAECGRFTVFEDRAAGAGRTLALRVTVVRSPAPKPAEPVVFLAGGPGEPGHGLIGLARGALLPVLEARDFVFVDVRGSGDSGRIDCDKPGLASDPAVIFTDLFPVDLLQACREELAARADLRLYTTELAVDDLDDLRRALGHERVLAWGGSYGTRLALTWLQRHPASLAGAVLDGVAPAQNAIGLHFARDAQAALDRALAACRSDAVCTAAAPDPSGDLAQLLRRLDAGEATGTVRPADGGPAVTVRLSRGHFGYAVRGMLYDPRNVPQLAAWIHQAAASGDFSVFAQAYYDRDVSLWPYLAIGDYLSVVCTEDVPRYREEDIVTATAGTFLGDYLVRQYRQACAVWPRGEVSEAFYEPIAADVPVLLLSGAYDPSTPPRWAELAAGHLPVSLHVVLSNGAHGAVRSECGGALTRRFLTTASLDGLDRSCADQGPLRFETAADDG